MGFRLVSTTNVILIETGDLGKAGYMTTFSLARELKEEGLAWIPALHDFFGVPDRGLDDRVFVISNMLVTTDMFQGFPVVAFQGASEWALDFLVTSEAVWIPTEEQLRQELQRRLPPSEQWSLRLSSMRGESMCEIRLGGKVEEFRSAEASEVYGRALLRLLRLENQSNLEAAP